MDETAHYRYDDDCVTARIAIRRGATFTRTYRPAQRTLVYHAVHSVARSAPARVETAAAHAVPDGWPVRLESLRGMTEIDATTWYEAAVVDSTHIDLVNVNALDYAPHIAGSGVVAYYPPADGLDTAVARAQFRHPKTGDLLLDAHTANGRIEIDAVRGTVTLVLPAADTAAITWDSALADVELETADGVVTLLEACSVTVTQEQTR